MTSRGLSEQELISRIRGLKPAASSVAAMRYTDEEIEGFVELLYRNEIDSPVLFQGIVPSGRRLAVPLFRQDYRTYCSSPSLSPQRFDQVSEIDSPHEDEERVFELAIGGPSFEDWANETLDTLNEIGNGTNEEPEVATITTKSIASNSNRWPQSPELQGRSENRIESRHQESQSLFVSESSSEADDFLMSQPELLAFLGQGPAASKPSEDNSDAVADSNDIIADSNDIIADSNDIIADSNDAITNDDFALTDLGEAFTFMESQFTEWRSRQRVGKETIPFTAMNADPDAHFIISTRSFSTLEASTKIYSSLSLAEMQTNSEVYSTTDTDVVMTDADDDTAHILAERQEQESKLRAAIVNKGKERIEEDPSVRLNTAQRLVPVRGPKTGLSSGTVAQPPATPTPAYRQIVSGMDLQSFQEVPDINPSSSTTVTPLNEDGDEQNEFFRSVAQNDVVFRQVTKSLVNAVNDPETDPDTRARLKRQLSALVEMARDQSQDSTPRATSDTTTFVIVHPEQRETKQGDFSETAQSEVVPSGIPMSRQAARKAERDAKKARNRKT